MSLSALLDRPWLYRLWQAPFAERKFAPLRRANDLDQMRRVLDVASGPGTNAHHFPRARYVGSDLSRVYARAARRRTGRAQVVADATAGLAVAPGRFDCVLINSVLHHLDDLAARAALAQAAEAASAAGAVHVLELVLPERPSPARWLARHDRGAHARPLEHWRRLCAEALIVDHWEPYAITLAGIPLWHMIYARGRPRR